MAVRNAYRRIQKWEASLDGDALSVKVGRLKDMMKSQIEEMFPALVNMEDRVKTVLDEEGISTTQYPFYLNFGRQCFKLVREFAGGTLINRANIVLQRWVADGFTQAILERIRDVVFTLVAPGP
jgi:hypothetical protein